MGHCARRSKRWGNEPLSNASRGQGLNGYLPFIGRTGKVLRRQQVRLDRVVMRRMAVFVIQTIGPTTPSARAAQIPAFFGACRHRHRTQDNRQLFSACRIALQTIARARLGFSTMMRHIPRMSVKIASGVALRPALSAVFTPGSRPDRPGACRASCEVHPVEPIGALAPEGVCIEGASSGRSVRGRRRLGGQPLGSSP